MPFWLVLGLAIASLALNILFRPKIKGPKPDAVRDLDDPTAEAGRPIPVVFGTVTVSGLNILWYGDKQVRTVKQKAG